MVGSGRRIVLASRGSRTEDWWPAWCRKTSLRGISVLDKIKFNRKVLLMTHDNRLTNAEELRVHTVEVGDKENSIRSCGIKKQQVAGGQVQDKTTSMHH